MSRTVLNHLKLAQHIADLASLAQEQGICLEYRTDFGYLVRLCETLPDKPYPTAMFNPLHHHIGPENGLWLKGTNAEGEVVHLCALRFDDLTGTNLARTFEDLTAFYTDPAVSAPPGEYCESKAPTARRITGRVVYHGEIWIREDLRGEALSKPLNRLAVALALIRWNPDFMYGFMYQRGVDRGLPVRYGYWHTEPRAVYWVRPYREEPLDVHLCWLERRDLVNQIDDWAWQKGESESVGEVAEASKGGATITKLRSEQ